MKMNEKRRNAVNDTNQTTPNTVVVKLTKEEAENLQKSFGTVNEDLAIHLLRQLSSVMPIETEENVQKSIQLSVALQGAIQPKDELEGLLATQMAAVHNLAMRCLGRANLNEQTTVGTTINIERATKLLRTFATQIETLNRYRGKGQQRVTVEHVTVNKGGQAVIGVVERPGGDGGDGKK